MLRNKIFVGFMLISTFCGMGCQKEKEKNSSFPTLVLGTSADNKPFEYFDTTGHAQGIIGYDIDVAKAVGKILRVQVEVKDMDFNGLVPALQAGRIDFAMAALTPTPERKQNVSFSEPYFISPIGVVARKDLRIQQGRDLEGLKVGVQLGTVFEQLLHSLIKEGVNIQLVSLNRLGDLIQEVIAGRLDCVVLDNSPAKAYSEEHSGLMYGKLEGYEIKYAIAFSKASPWVEKVNAALEELEKKGELEKISKRWFGSK